jgi:3D (Asp-Asp-Asp) domain-containing protein
MKVGTKIGLSCIGGAVLATIVTSILYNSIEVPRLEQQIQVLENTVSVQRSVNEQTDSERKRLNDLLYTSESKVQELEKQVADLKKSRDEVVKTLSNFEITWYNDTGVTYSGRQTQEGITISVDPRVIPLGTWVRIEFEDGTIIERRADDTGSAVKGKVIDIYKKSSNSTLMKLGRQHATVHIIDK